MYDLTLVFRFRLTIEVSYRNHDILVGQTVVKPLGHPLSSYSPFCHLGRVVEKGVLIFLINSFSWFNGIMSIENETAWAHLSELESISFLAIQLYHM